MKAPGDLIVTHFVDTVEVGGTFYCSRHKWPLHMTLAAWFTPRDIESVEQKLEYIAQNTPPFVLNIGSDALFGDNKDIPVQLIDNSESVVSLHGRLMQVLDDEAIATDSSWGRNGQIFMPHITRHDSHQSPECGARIVCDDFYVTRLEEGNICRVIARFTLGDAQQ